MGMLNEFNKNLIKPPLLDMTVDKKIEALPFIFDWVEYKGEVCFASPDVQKSSNCNRVVIDIFYCATRALNHCVLYTVNWNPEHFKPSRHSAWKY